MQATIKNNGSETQVYIDMYVFKNALENPYSTAETLNELIEEALASAIIPISGLKITIST